MSTKTNKVHIKIHKNTEFCLNINPPEPNIPFIVRWFVLKYLICYKNDTN